VTFELGFKLSGTHQLGVNHHSAEMPEYGNVLGLMAESLGLPKTDNRLAVTILTNYIIAGKTYTLIAK